MHNTVFRNNTNNMADDSSHVRELTMSWYGTHSLAVVWSGSYHETNLFDRRLFVSVWNSCLQAVFSYRDDSNWVIVVISNKNKE